MTVKTSMSLSEEQDAYARSLVAAGRYPSVSAVLQRGLEMLRRDKELHDAELEAVRLLIDQRREGRFVDLDEGEAETRAMLERKKKARAAPRSASTRRSARWPASGRSGCRPGRRRPLPTPSLWGATNIE